MKTWLERFGYEKGSKVRCTNLGAYSEEYFIKGFEAFGTIDRTYFWNDNHRVIIRWDKGTIFVCRTTNKELLQKGSSDMEAEIFQGVKNDT